MTEAMREKASARRVLSVIVGLLVTILALQGLASVKPGGFEAFAQATGTPTGPQIKLINPDSTVPGSSPTNPQATAVPEISSKNDGTETTYHLVAWVSAVPAGALVEFQY